MGNMFDNLGKGLNDFTKQAGKIAGNIGSARKVAHFGSWPSMER